MEKFTTEELNAMAAKLADKESYSEIERLHNALKLARLHIADTPLEHAVISLEQPGVGLGGYLDAIITEVTK